VTDLAKQASVPRIAIVVSHPIQHFVPQYESLARRHDFEIRVFFGSRAGLADYDDKNFGRAIRWDGMNLETFPNEFLTDQSVMPSRALDAPGLGARLRRYRPDVVLVYGYNQRLQRRARRWAIDHNVALLMFSDSELRQHRPLPVRALKALVLRGYFREINAFLTTGDANEEYYRHYGVPDRKMIRAPYPIDRNTYNAALAEADMLRTKTRRRFGIADSSIVCCMVGKFVSWKRQRDLIEMLRQPGTKNIDILLVGSGTGEKALRAAAEGIAPTRVHFAGFSQPRDLPSYYAAADIYVHTAELEPHSVAVSEAIFMGCPVVISDRCGSWGPTDDVQPDRNGKVYRCGDIAGLGRVVTELASDAELRNRFSATSRDIGERAQRLSHGDGWRTAMQRLGLIFD
jgi:glycosyltransferase involved in cell wall biosynthesis